MKEYYKDDRTKSSVQLFTTQNSCTDKINKIRDMREFGGIINPLNIKLKPVNKMNILPHKQKPKVEKLNTEVNYKVVGILLLLICISAVISFFILFSIGLSKIKEYKIDLLYKCDNNEDCIKINSFNEKLYNGNIKINHIENSLRRMNEQKYSKFEMYIKSSLSRIDNMFENHTNLISVDLSNINSPFIKSMSHTFHNCTNLEIINFKSFNSKNIVSMDSLFKGCSNLLDLPGFENLDTSLMENISEMFVDCQNLSFVNLSSFDLSKIKGTNRIFDNNPSLKYIILRQSDNNNNTLSKINNNNNTNRNI